MLEEDYIQAVIEWALVIQNINLKNLKASLLCVFWDHHGHKAPKLNKRAQRAMGRSPEEKVKGHSGANNREPQGHNFGRGPLDDSIYQI